MLEQDDMAELGMGCCCRWAAAASSRPLIVLKLQRRSAEQKPVVLVSKGITFDTGGISLKPGEGVDEMKFDMCGAASVLGAFQAAVECCR